MISGSHLLGDYTDRFWFPESASTFSDQVDSTFMLVLWICIFFMVPITFALVYFTIRFMKKKGEPAESQVSHNTPLEIAWSILPSFLLVWIFAKGALGYIDQQQVPDNADTLAVKAFKWGWAVDYGGGVIHPELHILNDQPTQLTMRSSDVIHSLFIPAFRVKRDIVPGRFNDMWFHPKVASQRVSDEDLEQAWADAKENNDGVFDREKYQFTEDGYRFHDLYCTEYCGKDHSKMQTVVVVHETREDLNAWIKKYSVRPDGVLPAEYGKLLYERRGCGSCHSLDGSRRVGPSFLGGFGSDREFTDGTKGKVDEAYIRESIIEPKALVVSGYNPVMPSYKGQLSDDDIDSIIAFLKSLSE
ncbi:MAG: cytochrome C [Planctomycetaceae bacterium]|nr:MAG: cytochrome C [Planctomycetaceae bacterium]